MRLSVLAAAALGVLVAFQIIRNAVVQGDEPMQPGSLLWRHHPDVLRGVAMREVGEAAARGQIPSKPTMQTLRMQATTAPRAPDIFLVEAALAIKRGESSRAERLLLQALRRNPRSVVGRFLLADLYSRSGRAADGLVQLAILTRIAPSSSVALAGALPQFARSGGTATQLRQVFLINPALEDQVLSALASDPANAELIVAAATSTKAEDGSDPPAWQEKLLNSLVARREYRKAYRIWLQLAGLPRGAGQPIFNPRYRAIPAPPPFNWTFASNAAGFAEGDRGNLRVSHYGAENAVLAKQLMLLAPGNYRLRMIISGSVRAENQLIWSVTCLPSGGEVLAAAIRNPGALQTNFAIPQGSCEAQRLELKGYAQEPAQVADVKIGPLQIKRATR